MKNLILILLVLFLTSEFAFARNRVVATSEYQSLHAPAKRIENQAANCSTVVDENGFNKQLSQAGIEANTINNYLRKLAIDWHKRTLLLLYTPDVPPQTLPAVTTLLSDKNKEKTTLVWRYCDLDANGQCISTMDTHTSNRSTIRSRTVGVDDLRDRSYTPGRVLIINMPRERFHSNSSKTACVFKT